MAYDERAAIIERALEKLVARARRIEATPVDREVCGLVSLRLSADPRATSMRAVCRIRAGVLTLSIAKNTAAGANAEEMVAEAPVEGLVVCLQRGASDMFTLATGHEDEMFDAIYCFCGGPERRFQWLRDFLRWGVAVVDLRDCECGGEHEFLRRARREMRAYWQSRSSAGSSQGQCEAE